MLHREQVVHRLGLLFYIRDLVDALSLLQSPEDIHILVEGEVEVSILEAAVVAVVIHAVITVSLVLTTFEVTVGLVGVVAHQGVVSGQ